MARWAWASKSSCKPFSAVRTAAHHRLGYQMSLGPWNTQVGASTSRLTYTLGKDFAVLEQYGSALVSSLVCQPAPGAQP